MPKQKINTFRSSLWVVICVAALVACGSNQNTDPQSLSYAQFAKNESLTLNVTQSGTPDDEGNWIPASTPDCSERCQKLRQEFRYIVYVGKKIYCYWPEKKADTGTNFDALASEIEQSIITKTTATQYYLLLKTWAGAFHDGHVNVLTKADRTELEIYTAPIRIEAMAPGTDHEKLIIVETGGEHNLSRGDEVVSINGVPASHALDLAEKLTSGSTKRMRRFFAARTLVDAFGTSNSSDSLSVKVLHRGDIVTVALPRTVLLTPRPTMSNVSRDDTGLENLKATVLPGNIGYLRIDGFTGTQDEFLIKQAMKRLAATKGLLIDLRQNGGGDLSGNVILSMLATKPITRYFRSERMDSFVVSQRPSIFSLPWVPGADFSEWHPIALDSMATYVDKPVFALIGPHCFSACDTFSSALKVNQLATMIGEGTGGGTGTPLIFQLPISGHRFRYSVVRGLTSDMQPIEGTGTLPDIVLEPTVEERSNKEDTQLLLALRKLNEAVGVVSKRELEMSMKGLQMVHIQDLNVAPSHAADIFLERIALNDEQ